MNELFGSEAKHSSFPWYSCSPSKIPDSKYSFSPWCSSSPSTNSFFPWHSSSRSVDSLHKQPGFNHDQVGTKGSTKTMLFGRYIVSSKKNHYKSSIHKFLYCSTPNILCNINRNLILSASAAASGISTSLKRTRCFKHLNGHRIVYTVGLGVTIALVSRVETVPYSKRKHFVIIPASKEKSFGDYSKATDKKIILPLDHPHSVRVRSISNKILQALQRDLKIKRMNDLEFDSMNINGKIDEKEVKLPWWRQTKSSTRHLEGLNWEVVVSDNDSCNAHCQPGGRIVVHKGLLRRLKSDAELAVVIGHEVGHAVARHNAESFTELLFLIGMLIAMLIIPLRSVEEMLMLVKLLHNPSSRRNEKEADYIGLLLMASAGYDPRVAPKVREMLGHDDSFDSKYSALLSHPSGKKRSEALSKPEVMEEAMTRFSKAIERQQGHRKGELRGFDVL